MSTQTHWFGLEKPRRQSGSGVVVRRAKGDMFNQIGVESHFLCVACKILNGCTVVYMFFYPVFYQGILGVVEVSLINLPGLFPGVIINVVVWFFFFRIHIAFIVFFFFSFLIIDVIEGSVFVWSGRCFSAPWFIVCFPSTGPVLVFVLFVSHPGVAVFPIIFFFFFW